MEKLRENEGGSNLGVNVIGIGRCAVDGEAKGGADVVDGGLELLEGELTVVVGVELLELVVDEIGEDLVVLNQLHYIRTIHHLMMPTFDRLHCTVLVHLSNSPTRLFYCF